MPDDNMIPDFIPPDEPGQRKRGGQPGNSNARKTGFYSARLPANTAEDFSGASFSGLHAEIDLLRALIGDVLEHAGEARTLTERVELLRAVTLATVSLGRMLRISPDLDQANVHNALQMALDKVLADMEAKGQRP